MDRDQKPSWWTAPRVASAALSLAVAIVGIGPGFVMAGAFDPELTVLSLTLVGLIWYTGFTYEALRMSETRDALSLSRSREGLATGLLAELKALEAKFRQLIGAQGRNPALDYFEHPVTEEGVRRLELFSPDTVGQLVSFAAQLSIVRQAVGLSRGVTRKFTNAQLVADATLAVRMIPGLAKALEAEGGTMPAEVQSDLIPLGGDEQLPDSPFGEFDDRRGWLPPGAAGEE